MKKFILAVIFVCTLSTFSYGAATEDSELYLRKDVFESNMNAFMTEMRSGFREINTRLDAMDKRINDMYSALNARIDDLGNSLNARIDDVNNSLSKRIDDYQAATNNRIEDLKTTVYWGFTFLGLILAFAVLGPSVTEMIKTLRKPSITLEDVERLINAKLSGISQ